MSLTKEAIYTLATQKIATLFEIPPAQLQTNARLYEDLDIDSIDAVDLLIELKKDTGIQLRPEQFKSATTLGDIVDRIFTLQSNSLENA